MASGRGHGSMSLSMKLIRLLIMLFNLAFIVIGAVLLAIGVYVVRDPKMQQLRPLLNPDLTSAYAQSLSNLEIFAICIIVIGGVLLLIAFLGCCGAIKGFRFLHVLYALIIGAIIIAEIGIIVFFLAYQNRFRDELVTNLRTSIANYYVGTPLSANATTNPISLAWDFAQFNLECCGAVTRNDFSQAQNWTRQNPYENNAPNLVVPFTCCPLNASKSWTELPRDMSSANVCAKTGSTAFARGCYDRLVDLIVYYKDNVIIGAVVVGVVQILAFLFAILLYCRKEDYKSV